MMNLPVFFTSVAARAARLFKTLEQAADFSSCSPAIAAAIAPFPILFTANGTHEGHEGQQEGGE